MIQFILDTHLSCLGITVTVSTGTGVINNCTTSSTGIIVSTQLVINDPNTEGGQQLEAVYGRVRVLSGLEQRK